MHDTRVAVRRFRSTLRVFGGSSSSVDAALEGYADLLGGVRDTEVLRELLAPLTPGLAAALDTQASAGAAGLAAFDAGPLHEAVVAFAFGWPAPSHPRRAVRRASRQARQRLASAGDDPDLLHRARRAAKRARYAAEAIGDSSLADRHARVQGALGDHHDCVVAARFVASVEPDPEREAALMARAADALASLAPARS